MCGIIGIARGNEKRITLAADLMSYRGPDARGEYADERISLAHNRLAIIDLDPRSTQPLWDEQHETCIIYNGEIYNYRKLRDDLKSEYRFTTESDTEVLLCGYKKYGPAFVSRLRGMFAFAIYDARRREIFLARDHAGIKPLYYCETPDFAFASEVQSLLSLHEGGSGLAFDHEAIRMYWTLGYIPAPYTAHVGIRVFPRASHGTFDLERRTLTITPYAPDAEPVSTEEELFSLIEKKVTDHTIADVPVGLFFSGGTDSSIIAAALRRSGHPLTAFSIRVDGRDKDERYFKAISETLGLDTHVFDFSPTEFNSIYEEVMARLDVPIADNSLFPSYFVAKKAREHVTVVLSGEGGDEHFFGYPRHHALRHMRAVRDGHVTFAEKLATRLPGMKGKNRMFSHVHRNLSEPVSFYIREMSPARDFLTDEFLRPAKSMVAETASDALYFDRDVHLENMLLRKADMSTMLVSLEGRVPLLDPDIVSSAGNFEKEFLSSNDLKPVLKRMLARDVPHDLVYRAKSGFGLSPRLFFASSKRFRDDVRDALVFFQDRDVPAPILPPPDILTEKYPDTAYAAVALFRALSRVV